MRLLPNTRPSRDPSITIRGIGAFTPAGTKALGVAAYERGARVQGSATETEWLQVAKADLEATESLLPNRKIRRMLSRGVHWGLIAAVEALADAQVTEFPCPQSRLGVYASGFNNYEDLAHLHECLRYMRENGLDWKKSFGRVATERLPPLMLLRRLPNAAFCHVAHTAAAKGYNATVLGGSVSGLDCMRLAAMAIQDGRLGAALVVAYDSPISWESTYLAERIAESGVTRIPLVLGEGGVALYLERGDLHTGRRKRPYARYCAGAASQARDGIVILGDDPIVAPRSIGEAMTRAVVGATSQYDHAKIVFLDVSDSGVDWLDRAESVASQVASNASLGSGTGRTGNMGNASGAAGMARVCYLLSEKGEDAAGLIVRASPTGQCSAVLLQNVTTDEAQVT